MNKKLKLLCGLMILPVLSACATSSIGPVVSEYCRIAEPITFDGENDTAETVRQIEAHNSKWACVCDNDCPKQE